MSGLCEELAGVQFPSLSPGIETGDLRGAWLLFVTLGVDALSGSALLSIGEVGAPHVLLLLGGEVGDKSVATWRVPSDLCCGDWCVCDTTGSSA